jgi:hypothetical protein
MPRTDPPCAPGYRRRIIELASAGRSIDQSWRRFKYLFLGAIDSLLRFNCPFGGHRD